MIIAGTALALVGYGVWSYVSRPAGTPSENISDEDKSKTVIEEARDYFTDDKKGEVVSIYKKDTE
jgi:hypothetical protein